MVPLEQLALLPPSLADGSFSGYLPTKVAPAQRESNPDVDHLS